MRDHERLQAKANSQGQGLSAKWSAKWSALWKGCRKLDEKGGEIVAAATKRLKPYRDLGEIGIGNFVATLVIL